jgi:hypothetical protein
MTKWEKSMKTKIEMLKVYQAMRLSGESITEALKVCTVLGGLWETIELVENAVEWEIERQNQDKSDGFA